ncbi:rho guanine nucleotide exchange factor 11 isoform X5 [Pelobates cultripes]|uniref:Rho guanine nucleotide exchange factor 11 isoform X5 n=1 Tax=Pelobates cultripes TaxID=61616 RepID=A0AAD1QXL6_PELCU|nr:rho guanine nucleotide exchange factor 11 isoform X5 [Pelobates cultripes]
MAALALGFKLTDWEEVTERCHIRQASRVYRRGMKYVGAGQLVFLGNAMPGGVLLYFCALLLDDLLVLLRKKRNKMVLKCKEERDPNTKTKKVFSPVIKLNNLLVHTVATDLGSFLVMDTSESPQLYEFTTTLTSEKNCIETVEEPVYEVIDEPSGDEEIKDEIPRVTVVIPDSCMEEPEERVAIYEPFCKTEIKFKTPDVPVIPPESCIETVEEPVYEVIGEPSGDED